MKQSYMKNSNVNHSIRKVVRHQFGHKTRTQTFHAPRCEFRTHGCRTQDIRTLESGPFSVVSLHCRQKMNFNPKRARMADDITLNREIFSNDSVFAYEIPLRKKCSKKARKWNLKEPIWCGCLKIFAVGNSCLLKFGDGEDCYGESFVGSFPDDNLFPAADSTRYYFVRIEFSDDKNDVVGIGFADRVDSGNFCDALLNFFQSPFAIIHENIKQSKSKARSESEKHAIDVSSNLESRFEKGAIISNETESCDIQNILSPSNSREECSLTSNLMPSALARVSKSKAAVLSKSNENEAPFAPAERLNDCQLKIQSKSKAAGLSNENEALFAPAERLNDCQLEIQSESKAAGLSKSNEALFAPAERLNDCQLEIQSKSKAAGLSKSNSNENEALFAPAERLNDCQLDIQSKSKATGLSNENEDCFAPVEILQKGKELITELKKEPCEAVDNCQLEIQSKSKAAGLSKSNENEALFAPAERLNDCQLDIQSKSKATGLSNENENEAFYAPVESLQGEKELITQLKTEPFQAVDDCKLEIQSVSKNNQIRVESGRVIPTKNIASTNLTSVASGLPSIYSSSLADRPMQSSLLPYGFSVNVSKALNSDDTSSSNSCYESECRPSLNFRPPGSNIQRNSKPGFSYSGKVSKKPVISHMQPREIEMSDKKPVTPSHFGFRRNSRFKLTNVYGINLSIFNANPKLDVSVDIVSHQSKQTQIDPSKSRCQSGKLNEVFVPGEVYCCVCQDFHVQYDCNHPEMSYGFPSRSKPSKW